MRIRYPSFDLDLHCDPIIRHGQRYLIGQLWISGTQDDRIDTCWIRLVQGDNADVSIGVEQILPTYIRVQSGKEVVFPFQLALRIPKNPVQVVADGEHLLHQLIRANVSLQVKASSETKTGNWQTASSLHIIAA